MTVFAVVCAVMISTGHPVCTDKVSFARAAAYVALSNARHPFNKGGILGAFTLFLVEDKPKEAGGLVLEGLETSP